jgi:hypothetical protein
VVLKVKEVREATKVSQVEGNQVVEGSSLVVEVAILDKVNHNNHHNSNLNNHRSKKTLNFQKLNSSPKRK